MRNPDSDSDVEIIFPPSTTVTRSVEKNHPDSDSDVEIMFPPSGKCTKTCRLFDFF
jgi:hypothetical protein